MKLKYFRNILEKNLPIKFHDNLSSGSRNVPCGRTDMTKFVVAFRNVVKAPKTEADEDTETSEETAFNKVRFSQYTEKKKQT